MWKSIVPILFIYIIYTDGCSRVECPKYEYESHSDRSDFLKYLPDEKRINEIALIGTHSSVNTDNQDLSIIDQLKYGVRVLDISVRATSDRFALHHDLYFLNRMFGDVLNDVDEFFNSNPEEFIILLLNEAFRPASDVAKSYCEILNDYMHTNMISNWSLTDTVGMYRGHILLGTVGDSLFSDCIVDLNSRCKVSSKFINSLELNKLDPIEQKAVELTVLQDASFYLDSECFINNIAAHSDTYQAARLMALDGSSDWYCLTPINHRMAHYFRNPHRALIIVMADFSTQELIDRIIYSNFEDYSPSDSDIEIHIDRIHDIANYILKSY